MSPRRRSDGDIDVEHDRLSHTWDDHRVGRFPLTCASWG